MNSNWLVPYYYLSRCENLRSARVVYIQLVRYNNSLRVMATASIKRGLCNPCQLCCRKIDDTRNRRKLGIRSAECATASMNRLCGIRQLQTLSTKSAYLVLHQCLQGAHYNDDWLVSIAAQRVVHKRQASITERLSTARRKRHKHVLAFTNSLAASSCSDFIRPGLI